MNENNSGKLIHIAKYFPPYKGARYLFLREKAPGEYLWYEEAEKGNEMPTTIGAPTIEEALSLGRKEWKNSSFRTIICGFRYTLPERDEHGINALFYQMATSYNAPNGVYFDEELGHNCFVQSASDEALAIWRRLKDSK